MRITQKKQQQKKKQTTNQQSEGKTAKRLRVPLTVQQQREQRQQQRCPHGALCGRPRFGSLRSPRRAPAALPRPRTRCPLRSRGRCAASPARPRLRPLGTGTGVGGGGYGCQLIQGDLKMEFGFVVRAEFGEGLGCVEGIWGVCRKEGLEGFGFFFSRVGVWGEFGVPA